jgi:hypothetical protein
VTPRLALLLPCVALAVSCKQDAPSSHAVDEAPVPAPGTLIAEGTLRDPDAFWSRVHKGGGSALSQVPQSAAGAILAWAGGDPALASLVSGASPFEIALGDAPDAGVAFAIAMKLSDPQAVRHALVEGKTAHYRAETLDGMTHLVPGEDANLRVALAVSSSGYLVVASTVSDLATLGAYAARTLPTKAPPTASFELRMDPSALARAGKKAPDSATKATAALAATARGLLPAEVDAGAFAACFTPGLRDSLATAGDLAEARVDADADDAQLDVVATLVPKPGDNAARRRLGVMHPADAAPLLDAPREAIAALFWSDTAEARTADASTLGPCFGRALAPILGPRGGSKLEDVMASWARGRGDWETASFVAKPSVAGLSVRAPAIDGAAVSAAVRGFVDLASQPSFAETIERLLPVRAGGVESIDVPRVGKASVVMFPSHAPPSRGTDPSVVSAGLAPPGLAWAVDATEVDLGLGQSPRDLLALTRPSVPLRTNASIARAVGVLGSDVSFAAVVVPPGCCMASGPAAAPLTIGWGRRAGNGRANLTIGDELLGRMVGIVTAP